MPFRLKGQPINQKRLSEFLSRSGSRTLLLRFSQEEYQALEQATGRGDFTDVFEFIHAVVRDAVRTEGKR